MIRITKHIFILVFPLLLSCNLLNQKGMDMQITYKVLSDDDFEKIVDKACKLVPVKNEKEEEIGDKVGYLQENIEKLLKAKWEDEKNWHVTYDFNIQYYTSGAIYSKELFSKEYIELVIKAIDLMDEPEIWAYDTVGEIIVNPEGQTYSERYKVFGEFLIKNKTVYIPQSMKKKYREMLGCKE